jgi:sugar phosphate isomerase/epimerase
MDLPPTPRLPLSLALAGLDAPGGGDGARRLIDAAAHAGFRAVQLDGASPATRPRAMARSARRDLAAQLRRRELAFSGVDLFLPPEHLAEPAHADRATGALVAAVEFAAELAGLAGGTAVVSTTLPRDARARASIEAIEAAAQATGVRVADHAWPPEAVDGASPIGVGIDPASAILAGGDPAAAASRAGAGLVSARLGDATATARVFPGDGRLDALAYTVAVVTAGYAGWVPLDLRGAPGALERAPEAVERFGGGSNGAPGGALEL